MTRKDYVAIAGAFAQAHADVQASTFFDASTGADALIGIDLVLDRIATVLAADNPRFDRGRFIAAATGAK